MVLNTEYVGKQWLYSIVMENAKKEDTSFYDYLKTRKIDVESFLFTCSRDQMKLTIYDYVDLIRIDFTETQLKKLKGRIHIEIREKLDLLDIIFRRAYEKGINPYHYINHLNVSKRSFIKLVAGKKDMPRKFYDQLMEVLTDITEEERQLFLKYTAEEIKPTSFLGRLIAYNKMTENDLYLKSKIREVTIHRMAKQDSNIMFDKLFTLIEHLEMSKELEEEFHMRVDKEVEILESYGDLSMEEIITKHLLKQRKTFDWLCEELGTSRNILRSYYLGQTFLLEPFCEKLCTILDIRGKERDRMYLFIEDKIFVRSCRVPREKVKEE